MIAVVAAYDTESTATPSRLLTSTGPGVSRAWAPSEWPELAASIGGRRVVTWGGGRWLEGACPEHAHTQVDLFALFVGQRECFAARRRGPPAATDLFQFSQTATP